MKQILGTLIAMSLFVAPLNALEFEPANQLRRPVALSWIDQTRLAVANRYGSISILDVDRRSVVDEHFVGKRISDLRVINDHTMIVLDEELHALIVLADTSGSWQEMTRIAMPHTPVTLALSQDRTLATVASLWSRRLTVVDLQAPTAPKIRKVIDLTFAPREQVPLNAAETLVAGAFGGHLAIVDFRTGAVVRHRELRATHNIAGIAIADRSRVILPHLMLNHEQATTGSNVHWGDIMSNVVRQFQLSWFRSTAAEETTAAELYYLGHPDDATGDPTGIVLTSDGRQVVAFAGINQMGISDRGANHYRRVPVGRRPVAFTLNHDESLLVVANQFDDSVSMIDMARRRLVETVPLGPNPELSLMQQGEILFYDSTLARDGWFSCHSCHTDGHSNGQLSDTFGDGYRGSPKRVLTLLGVAQTGPWAWNGQMETLEGQIQKSIETTMRGRTPTPHELTALAAYVRTLPPAPAVAVARGDTDPAAYERGKSIFHALGCVDCHQSPNYTSPEVYDVGLEDATGRREFNPPSLRGVSQRPRLLHDRRAASYPAALHVHPFGEPVELGESEWSDLTHFLDNL